MTNKYNFCHLHRHCEASIQDGVGKIEDGVIYAKEMEHPAVAITDHGNLISYVRFYNQAKTSGIKQIFGLEAYLCDDMSKKDKEHKDYNHATLLVKNQQGFKNILKLNNIAQRDGFYYRPRVDWDTLLKYKDGLIILSGCVIGRTCQLILNGHQEEAMKWNRMMKQQLGEDYYLELMMSDFPEQATCNKEILNISQTLNIPGVITADAHYTHKEDYAAQRTMMLLQAKATIKDLEEQERKKEKEVDSGNGLKQKEKIWIFSSDQYWMKNETELEDAWKKWHSGYYPKEKFDQHMNESGNIAAKVDDVPLDTTYKMPKADLPEGKDHMEFFKEKLYASMKQKNLKNNKAYEDRLAFEIDIIDQKGLVDYFLVNYDIISWCKRNDIFVGPGRGSAGGSLVCYLLNITELDPLKYDLLFERFLDLGRKEMPDIDTDFEIGERDRVKAYIADRYGASHYASIAALGTFKARNIIKDVMRVYNIDKETTDLVSSEIEEDAKFIDGELYDHEVVVTKENIVKLFNDYPHIKSISSTLFGQIRHISKHAAGVIITDKPLDECVALINVGGELMTAWTEGIYRKELTQLNVLKLDILGLKTLSIIKKACALANIDYRSLMNIDLDNKDIYETINNGKLLQGIFQFDSSTGSWLFAHMHPKQFSDIVALAALDRPGPLDSDMAFEYIHTMHGIIPKKNWPHQAINDVLSETYGVIVYQEQLMLLSQKLSGFNSIESSALRKNLVKGSWSKEGREKEAKERVELKRKFLEGAVSQSNCPQEIAEELWDAMEKFARYGFNKAHSVGYAYISFWTMWLKIYHSLEFYTALLSYAAQSKAKKTEKDWKKDDEIPLIVAEMRRLQIDVDHPNINKSMTDFTPDHDTLKILFGLNKIKWVGANAQKAIIENRPYISYQDFCNKIDKGICNKRSKEALIRAGAFESLNKDTGELLTEHAIQHASKKELLSIRPIEYSEEQQLIDEQIYLGVGISQEIIIKPKRSFVASRYKHYESKRLSKPNPELIQEFEKFNGIYKDSNTFQEYERFAGFISEITASVSKKGYNMLLLTLNVYNGEEKKFYIMEWEPFYKQLLMLKEGSPLALAIKKRKAPKDFPIMTHMRAL